LPVPRTHHGQALRFAPRPFFGPRRGRGSADGGVEGIGGRPKENGNLTRPRGDRAAALVAKARRIVVFTGAGISTESGIPDFRSPGGVWDRFDPTEFTYQKFVGSEESRRKYWSLSKLFYEPLVAANPNPAHDACVRLERWGRLDCVVTQNIDGLHQRAGLGPERVIELHGTALTVSCLSCRDRHARSEIQARVAAGDEAPRCGKCGGILKPDTVSFGQAMPEKRPRGLPPGGGL
jgi:NAD-dependent deacetylase